MADALLLADALADGLAERLGCADELGDSVPDTDAEAEAV